MKSKYIILLLSLLTFTGCVTIVKWKYGITNPREQTPVTLHAFLKKNRYPDSGQFIFTDTVAYFRNLRNTVFRKHLLSHMIFDSSGMLLLQDTAKCQWSGYADVKGLNPGAVYAKVNGLSLDEILSEITPIGPESGHGNKLLHPGFTVVVTWARFLGKYNSRLFELGNAVKENKTAGIRLIWLNIDMQESWNLRKNQKMVFN